VESFQYFYSLFSFYNTSYYVGFINEGSLRIAKPGSAKVEGKEFPYAYDIRIDNRNGRTIRQMSINANLVMRNEAQEYFEDFKIFADYYGQPDYADHWILAAANKTSTQFKSG
jgi:hypothetical protein